MKKKPGSTKPQKREQKKKPKRYPPERGPRETLKEMSSRTGVTNPEMAQILGQMALFWPQVEDAMIDVFEDLIGGPRGVPSRLIFKSLINPQTWIKVLTTLLQRAPINAKKSEVYDEVIREFTALNKVRNDYLHGLWETREDNTTVVATLSLDDDYFLDQRTVAFAEVKSIFDRMQSLRAIIRMKLHRIPMLEE